MSNVNYREIEKYINETVAAYMTSIDNIESVQCVRRADKVYMELVHEDSCVRYFDISGMDKSKVGIMIGKIVANTQIDREIRDRLVKKEIRKLFKAA